MKTTIMDILTILHNAGEAKKAFIVTNFKDYKHIGVKVTDNFNMFTPDKKEHTFPFTLVTNEKEANVSVRNMITGVATLNPKAAKRVGLPNTIECVQFKTYTIIKDGKLHTSEITVRVDESVMENLKAIGAPIVKTVTEINQMPCITLNFNNYEIANSYLNDDEVVALVQEINTLKVQNKVIKTISPTVESINVYTDEQKEVLAEYGIVNGIYNFIDPKENENKSSYKTREVLYQIKGSATIPSVNKALEASKRNAITQEVYDTFNKYKNIDPNTLLKMHQDIKNKLTNKQVKLQNDKLAYLLNNGTTTSIESNGVTLNIKISEKEKIYTA